MRTAILASSAYMAAAGDVTLQKVMITDPKYNPKCFDSSPFGYYFKEQTVAKDDSKPRTWLIYLGGGGFCYDENSCKLWNQLNPEKASSNNWQDTMTLGGIFDDDANKNILATANKVYGLQCSGDAWHGAAFGFDNEKDIWGFRMRGIPNFYAMIKNLIDN